MKKYMIYGRVTGLKVLGGVEAESLEAAQEKAYTSFEEEIHISLCHQCAREVELDEIDNFVIESEDGSESIDFDGNITRSEK